MKLIKMGGKWTSFNLKNSNTFYFFVLVACVDINRQRVPGLRVRRSSVRNRKVTEVDLFTWGNEDDSS